MPPPSPSPLSAAQLESAASVLARSFESDPFYAWMMPTRATRLPALREYFAEKLRRALATEAGTCLVSPSGTTVLLAEHVDGSDQEPALAADSRAIIARWVPPDHVGRVEDVMAAIPLLGGPHAYLDLIGTVPEARGRGEGAALARRWLETVGDDEDVRLDSSSTANLPFYERLGFVAMDRITLPHGAGAITPMRRGGDRRP